MGLDRSVVVEAGMDLARLSGIAAVGVRPIAGSLGVTPMALYRHIDDAAALHASVVDGLLAELPPVPGAGSWDDRCRRWAVETRAVLLPCPGLARLVLASWTRLPRVLRVVDGLGTMLEEDGPDGIDAVAAANAVLTYVLARAEAEEVVRSGGVARDLAVLSSLSDQVPFLWAHREEYAVARVDEHFAYGLDALLTGLATARR